MIGHVLGKKHVKNLIEFIHTNKVRHKTEDPIKPAKEYKPSWYVNAPFYVDQNNNKDTLKIYNGEVNATFRKCIPMLEAINIGYMVSLCADVLVENLDDQYNVTWKSTKNIFDLHGQNTKLIDPPDNYNNHVIKYTWGVLPKTPKGYSILVVEPLGFNNGVFKQIPAVVDTDKNDLQFALPMWVKKDFNGIVEAGTPLAQIIPFKKESWKSKHGYMEDNEYLIQEEKGFNKKIKNHYKDKAFNQKKYL